MVKYHLLPVPPPNVICEKLLSVYSNLQFTGWLNPTDSTARKNLVKFPSIDFDNIASGCLQLLGVLFLWLLVHYEVTGPDF